MSDPTQTNRWGNRQALAVFIALAVPAALMGVIFLIRLEATISRGDLYDGTGYQGTTIYNIWKVQTGAPLYERSTQDNFNQTVYSYLFYYIYSAILALAGQSGQQLVLGARLLTATLAGVGMAVSTAMVLYLSGRRSVLGIAIALSVAVQIWFSTRPMGWWVLSARPDVLSLLFVALATWLYCRSLEKGGKQAVYYCIASSMVFYLAWGVKHALVASLVGTCSHSLFRHRLGAETWALSLPFAIMAVVTLMIGGEVYWHNIIWISSLAKVELDWNSWDRFVDMLIFNQFLWFAGPVLLFLESTPAECREKNSRRDGCVALAFVFIVGVAWGLVTDFRAGGSDNGYLESCLAAGVLSASMTLRTIYAGRNGLLCGLLAIMALIAVYRPAQMLADYQSADLRLASQTDYEQRAKLAEYIATLPTPVFVADGDHANMMLCFPWYTTAEEYPTHVPDPFLYNVLRAHGVLKDDGYLGLIRQKKFASIVVHDHAWISGATAAAREAGYGETPLPQAKWTNGYRLFTRSENDSK